MTEIREQMFWKRVTALPWREAPPHLTELRIDLMPFTNTSAFSVPDTFSVSATYNLFRSMGLRHLVVVNKYNSVIGMITRKDLVAHTILKHTMEKAENLASNYTEEEGRAVGQFQVSSPTPQDTFPAEGSAGLARFNSIQQRIPKQRQLSLGAGGFGSLVRATSKERVHSAGNLTIPHQRTLSPSTPTLSDPPTPTASANRSQNSR